MDKKETAEQVSLTHLKQSYKKCALHSYKKRAEQLQQLKLGMTELFKEFQDAIHKDLGRHRAYSEIAELLPMIGGIENQMHMLGSYMKDVELDPSVIWFPSTLKLHYEPLGVALVMGSWNYPVFTVVKPLTTCIAAGNCAIIKPSELAPATAEVMRKLVENYLDPNCFKFHAGGVDVAVRLTSMPFDIICFTGSSDKGKLVAAAAAKNLVPCILELGGKCPVIVDRTADLDHVAYKVVTAKFQNAGQTCIGVDYIYVHESQADQLIKLIIAKIESFILSDEYLGKLINADAVKRLQDWIKTSGGKILHGGPDNANIDQRKLEPCLVMNPKLDSDLMQNEIFGPVLPILTYKDFDEVVSGVSGREKPLAIYFMGSTSSPHIQRLKKETSSGCLTVNEVMYQVAESEPGFGGVGNSGTGRCSGYEAFKQWSNARSIVSKYAVNVWPYNIVSPPYSDGKVRFLQVLLSLNNWKQSKTVGRIWWLFILFILFKFIFGSWGASDFRTQQVQNLLSGIKQWYGVN